MLGALCSPSKHFVSPISDTLVGFSCVPTYSAFFNFNLRSPSPFFHLPLCIVRDCTYTCFCLFPMLTPISFSGWITPISPPTIQRQKKKMLVSIILGSAIVVNNINVSGIGNSGGAGDCIPHSLTLAGSSSSEGDKFDAFTSYWVLAHGVFFMDELVIDWGKGAGLHSDRDRCSECQTDECV